MEVESRPLFRKRGLKPTTRKRPATPPPAPDSHSSGYTSSENERGERIKRRKKAAVVASNAANRSNTADAEGLATSKFAADRSATISESNDATKQSNWFDEKDPKHLLGSARAKPDATNTIAQSDSKEGSYKGASNYHSYVSKNPSAPSKQVGPVKAPTNIRTITVTDFAPDVCKDYKQTGFCGFGDSCKFLHAREDYKQGWEIDRDWEINGKGKKRPQQDDSEDEEEATLENIPFACIICKEPYTNPVVTKCGHYFCEACALKRYRKSPTCAACGAGTNGVFNGAKQLRKLLARKRERARRKKDRAREEGEDVSEDDDEEG
ncbi:RNA-splicing factor [Bacidia gigantensis]|uniref:RNA-splicing factor n=1 Tax=Bacidia gigantensis TaxID=2732470 RepID=UPI001D03C0FF|nr:RNA-splicing factor [Bacidia gigantensis]KAG8525843.1 RNA-splicing factor [Bacidia gigantensis]